MRGATKKLIVNKKNHKPEGDVPMGSNSFNPYPSGQMSNPFIHLPPSPPVFTENKPSSLINFNYPPNQPRQISIPKPNLIKNEAFEPELDVVYEKNEELEFSHEPSKMKKNLLPPPQFPIPKTEKKTPISNIPPNVKPLPVPAGLIPNSLPIHNFSNQLPGPPQMTYKIPSFPPPQFSSTPQNGPGFFSPPIFNPNPFPMIPNNPSHFLPQIPSNIPTNIFEITFDDLRKQQVLSTGDPLRCSNCQAFLSHISQPGPTWKCEFCEAVQSHDLDPEETPKHNKILYLLQSPSQTLSKKFQNFNQTIIFCIDISGSMSVTIPISTSIQIKTNKLQKMREELMSIVGAEWMQVANSSLNYISRLDCVQAAIESQLESLSVTNPDSSVGLITFNDEVCIIGDGSSVYTISGDYLNSSDAINKLLESKYKSFLSTPIKSSKSNLQEKLLSLTESGSTALGPALLSSILLASQSGSGSKVIVCTDGVANTGLGDIENENNSSFYLTLADLASEKGVEVSVISISDQECRLDALIPIVEKTGGDLSKVNPATLSQDFANILSTRVYATHTKLTVRLSEGLEFKDGTKTLNKDIGNVNDDTIFTFEFLVNENPVKQLIPLQVEIQYKDMQGNMFVLVHTENLEVAENQEEVIKEANFEIISKNAQFQGANLIKQGRLREADESLSSWNNFMMSNQSSREQSFQYQNMISRTTPIQQKIQTSLNIYQNKPPGSGPATQPVISPGLPQNTSNVNRPMFLGLPMGQSNNISNPVMPSFNTFSANNQMIPPPLSYPNHQTLSHFSSPNHQTLSHFPSPDPNRSSFYSLPNIPLSSPAVSDDLLSDAMKLLKNQKK